MNENYAALILAGGQGTRLWPLSRTDRPKPFLTNFPDPGPSLIARTLERLQGLIAPERTFIITGAAHVQALQRALPGWPSGRILVEPAARNTACAIAYGISWVEQHHQIAPVWAVLPADHSVRAPARFRSALDVALAHAATGEELVTLGVVPTHPSTQYGYIELQRPAASQACVKGLSFAEKPDAAQAQAFVNTGRHLWNAGIFVGHHQRFVDELSRLCPNIWQAARACAGPAATSTSAFVALAPQAFDRAVMEQLASFGVVVLDAGWSDVGQWSSAAQQLDRDPQGNAVNNGRQAQSLLVNATGCNVWNPNATVAILGARDLTVVVEGSRVLIVAAGHEHEMGKLVARLEQRDDT